jgi:GNAT superfamily N-acetyltransferase
VNGIQVTTLDQTAPGVAAAIRDVMREAYLVEAGLIGVTDFVPLQRGAEDIAGSKARFLGISVDGELAAVAEVDDALPEAVNIDALVVRPRLFRTGLASALLRAIVEDAAGWRVTVSTAAGNTPALELYAGLGFLETGAWTTPDGIAMVTLATRIDGGRAASRETDERSA